MAWRMSVILNQKKTSNSRRKPLGYMPFTKRLEHQDENFLNSIPNSMPVVPRISGKRLNPLQPFTISMNELQSHIKGK